MMSCVDNSHFQDHDKYGGKGRRDCEVSLIPFSPMSCSSSILSFTQVKGSFNNSCFLQCLMCSAKRTLPGNLGTKRRKVNVGSCRKKPAGSREVEGQPLQEVCSGAAFHAGGLQGGLQSNQELPLPLQVGGGWRHIP